MDAAAQPHSRPIHYVRWTNFRALLADRKLSITEAARLLGKSQGQVSHFGGKVPIKAIGGRLATEIEAAFGMPHGCLDNSSPVGHLDQISAALSKAQALIAAMQSPQVGANNSFKPKPLRGSA